MIPICVLCGSPIVGPARYRGAPEHLQCPSALTEPPSSPLTPRAQSAAWKQRLLDEVDADVELQIDGAPGISEPGNREAELYPSEMDPEEASSEDGEYDFWRDLAPWDLSAEDDDYSSIFRARDD